MLIILAWRNIWRKRVRSLVVVIAIMMGLWAGAFIIGYGYGMIDQRMRDAIDNEVSHLQVHQPDFEVDYEVKFIIPDGKELLIELKKREEVKNIADRVISFGMVASAKNSLGGKFIGVDPDSEIQLTKLDQRIVEGSYFEAGDKNKVLIGKKLAEKLKVRLNSKIVLTCQDTSGNIVAGAFKVKGLYTMYNSAIEKTNIYLLQKDLSKLVEATDQIHEIAVLVHEPEQLDQLVGELRNQNPEVKIEGWKEISPELGMMVDSLDQYLVIFIGIILLALSFGIINTMLMSVLERYKEIGMLMAVGMNRRRLFAMIVIETLMLVFIAVPFGLLAAYGTISYLGEVGMDLSAIYAEGYAEFGFKSIIYPKLATENYITIMIMVAVAAILSSIFPAITAVRLNPLEAIRKI